jgi:hypothetical protein
MIKFFRKMRQSLLVENKLSRYLLYAIGEIVLVVIGIMIALYFNNLNQDRINEIKIKATLVEIQSDIATDIRFSMLTTYRYLQRDTVKNLLFNNELTADDIKSGRYPYVMAAFRYDPMLIRSTGYNKLILDINDIPKKYNELVNSLNHQYKIRKPYLELLSNKFIEDCFKNENTRNHLDWYGRDVFTGEISDQQIDYYLNDPEFKKLAIGMSYNAQDLFSAITGYRVQALNSYFLIEELLGEEALETPDHIRRTTLADAEQAQRLRGSYRLIKGPTNTNYKKEFEITSEGKQLYVKLNNGEAQLLYAWHPEKLEFFTEGGSSLIRFPTDSPDKLTIVHGSPNNTIWEKK